MTSARSNQPSLSPTAQHQFPQHLPHQATARFSAAVASTLIALIAGAPIALGQVAERIGDGIVRFYRDDTARQSALPSMALQAPRQALGPAPAGFVVTPAFSADAQGRQVVTIDIDDATTLYGNGQVAGPLRRNGRQTQTWNLDAYGYQDDATNLYTSHPWVMAVRGDGSAFGVLADTTHRVHVDLSDDIVFAAQGPAHPVIVIEGPHPKDVISKLGELTGTIEMPPRWAIGYHQCRYSYNPDSRVIEVATEFRERQIPADVIWMDIDYMDGFRCFTFDQAQFPDPKGLNDTLDRMGFQSVYMIDPGIKNEPGYFVHDSGDAIDAWVKSADGSEFNGHVWPGECVFPDFTNARVRSWWAGLYADFMATGIDGVWNDMNEPAVFNVPTKTMPEDNWHRADPELGGPGPHARFHNVYGMLMVEATREGVMKANPDKRPFVLSRANYIGGQRYGATWTGDNSANWYHVDVSIPMTLNLGLSGQPFAGPDIGGFAGNGTPEMYRRWIGFGALLPFSRSHTAKGNIDKEPWAFGEEVEATARRAIERRYRLMPLLYTLFEESHRTGLPVARPLFFADPADIALRSEDDSFLLGDNLLVAADTTPGYERTRVMPRTADGQNWREFAFIGFDGRPDSIDPDQPRLYIRPGGIVPTGPVHQHFGDRPDQRDELTLIVAPDTNGSAQAELYEDEGDGWGFRQGRFVRTRYSAMTRGDTLTITSEKIGGQMDAPPRVLRARVILQDGREVQASGLEGRPLTVKLGT